MSGCSTTKKSKKRPPGQTKLRVERFKIEGNEHFSDSDIKEGLATEKNIAWRSAISWMPVLGKKRSLFNRIHWKHDLERIRVFYKRHGYFDAKIVTENIIKRPSRGAVYLKIKIHEGKPTRIEDIQIHGVDFFDRLRPEKLKSGLPVETDAVFTQQNYFAAKTELVDRLRNRGFAYVETRGRVNIDPNDRRADIHFYVDPGPPSVFGEVDVRGLEEVEKDSIERYISFKEGQSFRGDVLEQTRNKLYGLDVFSLARVIPEYELQEDEKKQQKREPKFRFQRNLQSNFSVRTHANETPELDEPTLANRKSGNQKQTTSSQPLGIRYFLSNIQQRAKSQAGRDPVVPVVVKLKETRLINVEAGTGFSVESNRQEVEGQLNWSNKNFLGGLRRLEHFNRVGYAWALDREQGSFAPTGILTGSDAVRNRGAILSSRLQMTQPGFWEEETKLRLSPSIKRDIDIGYRYWNPSFTIGLNRTFFGNLDAGLSYNFSYYAFDNIDPAFTESTPLGEDFQRQFVLETIEQKVSLDFRDSPLNPTQGTFYKLTAQEASNYLFSGEFDFLKLTAEFEGYLPFELGTEWVSAGRAKLGSIYNLEPVKRDGQGNVTTQRVPTLKRLYSGGKNQMRSFGRNQISLFRGTVPVGGLTLFETSFEQRFRLVKEWVEVGDVWGSAFVDSATVLRGQLLAQTAASRSLNHPNVGVSDIGESLLHGVGAGLWWETPLGPIRGDFAYTLSNIDTDPRYRTCQGAEQSGQITGYSNCQYVPRGQDPVQKLVPKYSFNIGIGHSF